MKARYFFLFFNLLTQVVVKSRAECVLTHFKPSAKFEKIILAQWSIKGSGVEWNIDIFVYLEVWAALERCGGRLFGQGDCSAGWYLDTQIGAKNIYLTHCKHLIYLCLIQKQITKHSFILCSHLALLYLSQRLIPLSTVYLYFPKTSLVGSVTQGATWRPCVTVVMNVNGYLSCVYCGCSLNLPSVVMCIRPAQGLRCSPSRLHELSIFHHHFFAKFIKP